MARILVIDDTRTYLTLCRTILEEAGHAVEVAEDGFEGLSRYRKQAADVVVCDLFMPDKDGFQTVAELRTFSSVPILVMSGRVSLHPGARFFDDALKLGANGVLRKPFIAQELLSMVAEMLRPAA